MRILTGSIAGGLLLLIWVFLADVLPLRDDIAFRAPLDDVAVHQVLSQNLESPGVYWSLRDLPKDSGLRSAYFDGPTFIIHYSGGGHRAGVWESLLALFVVLLAPLVPTSMLCLGGHRIMSSYPKRVGFIAGFGLFLAVYSEPFRFFFEGQPLHYTALLGASSIIGWILVGAVVAAIVRPRQVSS